MPYLQTFLSGGFSNLFITFVMQCASVVEGDTCSNILTGLILMFGKNTLENLPGVQGAA